MPPFARRSRRVAPAPAGRAAFTAPSFRATFRRAWDEVSAAVAAEGGGRWREFEAFFARAVDRLARDEGTGRLKASKGWRARQPPARAVPEWEADVAMMSRALFGKPREVVAIQRGLDRATVEVRAEARRDVEVDAFLRKVKGRALELELQVVSCERGVLGETLTVCPRARSVW